MLNIPIEVQDALREGALRKNYKMKVNDVDPDTGERTYLYTIDNDTLVSESVKVDERMVTGKVLKFGLCEGSSLEFQYFDHPNINGKDVQVYCSVEYVDGNGDVAWYDIPMGWYSVDQCPMQWETGIYKVTAYNKLKSKYLDAKVNALLIQEYGDNYYYLCDILDSILADFKIEKHDLQPIEEGISAPYTDSNTFKITEYWGNQGPISISGWVDKATWTTSSNFWFRVYRQKVTLQDISASDYIRGLEQEDFDGLYDNFEFSIKYKLLNGIIANKTMEQLWDLIKDSCNVRIVVTKSNSQVEYYGSGAGTVGSIEYFFKNTHTDATNIYLEYPIRIEIFSDASTAQGRTKPKFYLYGGLYTYYYKDSASDPFYLSAQYDAPKYPDGTEIAHAYDKVEFNKVLDIAEIETIQVDVNTFPEVTLRELQSAVYETVCQYGQLNRETDLFEGVELNQGGLYPSETLYPDDALYPLGTMEHPFPSTYSKLWTDTVGEQSFRYLIITYKAMENGEEVEKTLQRTVNADGTTNYNMSDNWLFRNLIWTAADVGDYADAMVLKMKDIRWFPFEMWCAGLPYVETGDAIEITDRQGDTHTSYVLTRTLDGIHNLQDTFINGELDIF